MSIEDAVAENIRLTNVKKFLQSAILTARMAIDQRAVCYMYSLRGGKFRYGASFEYWDDWILKAYPDGARQISDDGFTLYLSMGGDIDDLGACEHPLNKEHYK